MSEKELLYFDGNSHKFSKKYKIRMNRIFREKVKSNNIPYPEVDNCFQRIRSQIAVLFIIRKK